MQGAFQIPVSFDTGTNKIVVGDGNDFEPLSLPAYTGGDASIVTATTNPVTGGLGNSGGVTASSGALLSSQSMSWNSPTGTDATAVFESFKDLLKNTTNGVISDTFDGYRQDRARLRHSFPSGVLLIERGEAIGDLFGSSSVYGLTIEGNGPSATVIHFNPTTMYDETDACQSAQTTSGGYVEVYLASTASSDTNKYLGWTFTATSGAASGETATVIAYDGATRKATLSNALSASVAGGVTYGIAAPLINSFNRYYGLTVKGVRFHGGPNAAKRNLFAQYSNGTAQDSMFERCEFTGTWHGLFSLYAPLGQSGNNSEFLWNKCVFEGEWKYALRTMVSNQLLNYWFQFCKYWTTAPWIVADKGSNFHILNSDISVYGLNYNPANIATTPTYLVTLTDNVNDSSLFRFIGNRVECHHVNARIINSSVSGGKIIFSESAFGWNTAYGNTNGELFTINLGNFGPSVSWRDCELLGKANFLYGSETYRVGKTHSITNCFHQLVFMPEEFIVSTGGGNSASKAVVSVEGWGTTAGVASQNRKYLGDGTVNGDVGATVSRKRLSAALKSPQGSLPGAGVNVDIRLPVGSSITGVHFHIPVGASADSSSRTWLVKSGVSSPVTIATLTATPSAGIATLTQVYKFCGTSDSATITLEPQTGAPFINGAMISVDYIS